MYIYRSVINGEDFSVEKIDSEAEYMKVARAYMEMRQDKRIDCLEGNTYNICIKCV